MLLGIASTRIITSSICTPFDFAFLTPSILVEDPYIFLQIARHVERHFFISNCCNGQSKFTAKDNNTRTVLILATSVNVSV